MVQVKKAIKEMSSSKRSKKRGRGYTTEQMRMMEGWRRGGGKMNKKKYE
jgi:hypothetical protein